jgi:hypothetical protein
MGRRLSHKPGEPRFRCEIVHPDGHRRAGHNGVQRRCRHRSGTRGVAVGVCSNACGLCDSLDETRARSPSPARYRSRLGSASERGPAEVVRQRLEFVDERHSAGLRDSRRRAPAIVPLVDDLGTLDRGCEAPLHCAGRMRSVASSGGTRLPGSLFLGARERQSGACADGLPRRLVALRQGTRVACPIR